MTISPFPPSTQHVTAAAGHSAIDSTPEAPVVFVGAQDTTIPHRYIAETARPLSPPQPITNVLQDKRYQSPLRYPGAKRGLVPVIAAVIERAVKSRAIPAVDLLIEPFAGGASASLRLVGLGVVNRAVLSDADPLVASFWQVASAEPQKLIARMRDEHERWVKPGGDIALSRWDYWKAWRPDATASVSTNRFEMAVKCLFLNRTTFSGILHGGAGPIGGRAQTSAYDIGCRFNPDGLAERVEYVGHLYETHRIADVWCLDWKDALDQVSSAYKSVGPDKTLAYLDPPYFEKSQHLYNKSFGSARDAREWTGSMDHQTLAGYLRTEARFRWLLSYDHDPELLSNPMLYAPSRMRPSSDHPEVRSWFISKRLVDFTYTTSAQSGRSATSELLLTTLPASAVPTSDRLKPLS